MNTYPLAEALKAQQALREAANLPPEQFPVEAFVGMVSDEIEQLREQGKSDSEIAAIIERHSNIRITGEEVGQHYASPEERHAHES